MFAVSEWIKRRLGLLFLLLVSVSASIAAEPKLLLLKNLGEQEDVSGWLMSEKLDGVRAYWDGKHLVSKGGKPIHAPEWFVRKLPPFALDGELWTKRQDFENIVSIVRQKKPDSRWHQIQYCIFEVPNQPGHLRQRLKVLLDYLAITQVPWLNVIPQEEVNSRGALYARLDSLIAAGAEGLVLRKPDVNYQVGRSSDALKVKSFQDDECVVLGYEPGQGKYRDQVGSLRCRTSSGLVIKLGSGLTDALRKVPPEIGALVTYKFYGVTRNGKPRFPVFVRVRVDSDLN